MAKKENGKYEFALSDVLVTPLNDDLTQPSPENIIGGVGPFDFSGATTPAAVPLITKIDTTAAETVTVNLSAVGDIEAVTVDELVTAINLAAPADVVASKQSGTNRLKFAYDGAGTPERLQVYGLVATTALIGQGKGVKIVYSDSMQSMSISPISKDEETFTITDAMGTDTEVITDGYRKGCSGSLVDTSIDWELKSIVEGGTYDSVALDYEAPNSTTRKVYFNIEAYSMLYNVGSNKEADLVGYVKENVFSAKGTFGDKNKAREFGTSTYNFTATSWRDAQSVLKGDSKEAQLTVSAYEALNLKGLVS
jgi:hypothetical protein